MKIEASMADGDTNNSSGIQYLAVIENDNDDVTEIPSEENGNVLLDTLTAQFPAAIGLKYRSEDTGNLRAVRVAAGEMKPPEGGWASHTYYVVYPKAGDKRGAVAAEAGSGSSALDEVSSLKKYKGGASTDTQDLIVLGLPWKMTDEDLIKHFEQFGKIVFAQIKRNGTSGQSRGYGFIRYETLAEQALCLVSKHFVDDRYLEVRIPDSGAKSPPLNNRKIYVKMTTDVPSKDLREYFSKYGDITELFCPVPFKGYAFITFLESGIAHKLYGKHTVTGIAIEVGTAAPKRHETGSGTGYQGAKQWRQQGNQYDSNKQYGTGANSSYMANQQMMQKMQQQQQQQQQNMGYGYGASNQLQGYGNYGTAPNMSMPPPPPPPAQSTGADALGGINPSIAAAALALLANMSGASGMMPPQQQQGVPAPPAAAATSGNSAVPPPPVTSVAAASGATQQSTTSSAYPATGYGYDW